jgi:RNA polymerase sigma-70 factor (ECF subfamily)
MEDREIVELYWQRREEALGESRKKYGGLCFSVALSVLGSREDAEEAASDALLRAWNSIPPQKPEYLDAYLAKLSRRAAVDLLRRSLAGKRWSGEAALALEELEECVPSGASGPEERLEASELAALIARFLRAQPETVRKVFLRRYWYVESVSAIAEAFGWSESKVKSILFRTRKGLRRFLETEGYL